MFLGEESEVFGGDAMQNSTEISICWGKKNTFRMNCVEWISMKIYLEDLNAGMQKKI